MASLSSVRNLQRQIQKSRRRKKTGGQDKDRKTRQPEHCRNRPCVRPMLSQRLSWHRSMAGDDHYGADMDGDVDGDGVVVVMILIVLVN